MNQIVLFRVAMVVLGALAIGFLVGGLCLQPGVQSGRQAQADDELVGLLHRLRATTDSQARARMLRDSRREGRMATEALRRVLTGEGHPMMAEAIEVAGALGVADLRPEVVRWVERGEPEVRAAAIVAAERLAPWKSVELTAFLETGVVPIQLAVLEIAAHRSDVPWAEILQLLSTGEPQVRRAVVKALPIRPCPEAAAALRDVLGQDASDVVVAGLTILRRTELIGQLEADVTKLVRDLDPKIQAAALDCLAAKGAPVVDSKAILSVVWDTNADASIRARALHCLERTGSDLGDLKSRLGALDPGLRYFAARCLLSAGDPRGESLLLELVDEPAEAATASRQLLATLTHLSPAATADEFRHSLEANPPPRGPLPPPGGTF